jgi:glycerol-3-phosphate dehydrogenase
MRLDARTRAEWIRSAPERLWDLLVVGGGITGAGIALDAASRGLSVFLAERADFASGTSSRSSRLIHGGLRYLRQGQPRVTMQSAREREILRRLAPHLVQDLPFLFPIFAGPIQRAAVGTALWAYDAAAGFPRNRMHRSLSPLRVERVAPGLRREGLAGALLFHDARADDARLVIHVLATAALFGARVVNYAPLERFAVEDGRVAGAEFLDTLTGAALRVRARAVVAATGIWAEDIAARAPVPPPVRLRLTKGAHLVLRRTALRIAAAVVLPSPEDGRMVFAIPHDDCILLGTTDTDYHGPLHAPRADDKDIEYLLRIGRHYFGRLDRSDLLATYAGIRPLVRDAAASPSATSREYRTYVSRGGLILIAGGKLTTYRRMAQEAVDLVFRTWGRRPPPCRTDRIPLLAAPPGGTLVSRYGRLAPEVQRRTDLMRPLADGLEWYEAEIAHAAECEMAITLADVLLRRTRAGFFLDPADHGALRRAAAILGDHLGWSSRERARSIEEYLAEREQYAP